jgi:hypothetical protein
MFRGHALDASRLPLSIPGYSIVPSKPTTFDHLLYQKTLKQSFGQDLFHFPEIDSTQQILKQ